MQITKFCTICNTETEQFPSGGCKPCATSRRLKNHSVLEEKREARNLKYFTEGKLCAKCGTTERNSSGSCKFCAADRAKINREKNEHKWKETAAKKLIEKPMCKTCGGVEYTNSGRCRACLKTYNDNTVAERKQSRVDSIAKRTEPCIKCGGTSFYTYGGCKDCKKTYGTENAGHTKERAAATGRRQGMEAAAGLLPPCPICGSTDRSTTNGKCKPCSARRTTKNKTDNKDLHDARKRENAALSKLGLLPPCTICGGVKFTPKGVCSSCSSEHSAKWRAANPEQVKAIAKAQAAMRPAKIAAIIAELGALPPCKKCGGTEFSTYGACKVCASIASAKGYEKNRDKILAGCAARHKAHPEKTKVNTHRRRAILQGIEGFFTEEDVLNLWDKQEGKCCYCDDPMNWEGDCHLEHIICVSPPYNGTNWPHNLQLTCEWCNLSKGTKTNEEFLIYRIRRPKPERARKHLYPDPIKTPTEHKRRVKGIAKIANPPPKNLLNCPIT